MAGKLFVNNSNGRKARATKAVFNNKTGLEIFTWMSDMVKDGLAETNPDSGTSAFDNLLGIGNGNHAMAIDTSAVARHDRDRAGRGAVPQPRDRRRADAGPQRQRRRERQGGELFMVNKSAPEKQAAAWQYLKFLDTPESQATWAVGTGYLPILKKAAAAAR